MASSLPFVQRTDSAGIDQREFHPDPGWIQLPSDIADAFTYSSHAVQIHNNSTRRDLQWQNHLI